MRLRIMCGHWDPATHQPCFEAMSVPVRDDGVYCVTCADGHVTTIVVQESDFEVLSEIGATAIIDGYYRDAVSSFTAALERLQEFYVRVVLAAREFGADEVDAIWSPLAKQSERQLGLFVGVYALETHGKPPLLHTKYVKLRNMVTHDGLIPTREQALTYGQAVLDVCRPIMEKLKGADYAPIIRDMVSDHLRARVPKQAEGKVATYSGASPLSLTVAGHDNLDLKAYVALRERSRKG